MYRRHARRGPDDHHVGVHSSLEGHHHVGTRGVLNVADLACRRDFLKDQQQRLLRDEQQGSLCTAVHADNTVEVLLRHGLCSMDG